MAERIDVFISSTSRDLEKHREAVRDVVLRLGMHPIIMEAFNPTDRNALQLCYEKVQQAEIFIGIYAHRYGYAPGPDVMYTLADGTVKAGDGETSITHWEYLWALERGRPIRLFVIGDTDANGKPLAWPLVHIEDEPGKSRLKAFKAHIGKNHVWREFHSPDNLAAQVATALAELKAEIQPPQRCDFYQHVNMPPNYVPRTDLLAELRLALLGDDHVALTSAIKGVTALHGMGGIGKSVIARALCDDPEVRAAFPDGILWTTLGQNPNLAEKLREWVEALGGQITENAPTENTLKTHLAELLKNHACLLIVDDVWHKKHGDAFRVGGEQCRLLLTTRDAEVARELGAAVTPIPTMSEVEAVTLLRQWADGSLDDADPALLGKIAARLSRLPLALKLAGAQLRRKSPQEWLERYDVRKLETRRADPDDPHSSLERCFGLSLDELKTAERSLYAALAIFREDEPIREQVIARLWGALANRDADAAQELLDDLAARALLEVVGKTYPRAAILHDLLRDFMAAELADPLAAHHALLDAYAQTKTGDGWPSAPDDGYLYEHLAYHLRGAGRGDDIHALFTNDAWMQARHKQSGYTYTGFLADLEVAWQTALEQDERRRVSGSNTPIEIIPILIRYGLLRSTVVSLSTNIVPELMARAVETGVWEAERALRVAANVPYGQQRVETYALLLKTAKLSEEQRERAQRQAIETALSIDEHTPGSLQALKLIASELTDEQLGQILNAVLLRVARSAKAELEILAPYLSIDQLTLAVDAIAALEDPYDRQYYYETTEILNYRLKKRQETAEEIAAIEKETVARKQEVRSAQMWWLYKALTDSPEWHNASIHLTYLIPGVRRNDQELLDKALQQLWDVAHRLGLKEVNTKSEIEILLDEFLRIVSKLVTERELSEILSGEYKDREEFLAYQLKTLAPRLNGELLDRALEAAMAIEAYDRVEVIEALAGQMTEAQLQKVMDLALKFTWEPDRVSNLRALASQLKGALMERAVEISLAMEDEENVISGLKALVPYLDEPLLERVFTAAIGMNHSDRMLLIVIMRLFCALMPRIRGELLNQALQFALHLSETEFRELLALLAPNLGVDLVTQAVRHALVIRDETWRVLFFADIAERLNGEQREKVTVHAFGLALNIKSEGNGERTKGLMALADLLDETQLEIALDGVLSTEETWVRPQALLAMVPRLEGAALERAVEALTDFIAHEGDFTLGIELPEVFAAAGQLLKGHFLERLLNTVIKIDDEYDRAVGLITLAPYMSDLWLERTLHAAREMNSDYAISIIFAAQVYSTRGIYPDNALGVTLETIEEAAESYRGKGNAWRLNPPRQDESKEDYDRSWSHKKCEEELRALALCVACSQLSGNLLERVLHIALIIEDEGDWVDTVCAIIPCLDDDRRHEVLSLIGERFLKWAAGNDFGILNWANLLTKPRVTETSLAVYLDIAAKYANEDYQGIRQKMLSQFVEVAFRKPEENDLVNVLRELAPYVDGDLLERLLARTLELQALGNQVLMLSALASRRPDWVRSKADILFLQIAEVLHEVSKYQRYSFVFILRELLPLWFPLVHDECVSEISQTLIEVCEKWEWV